MTRLVLMLAQGVQATEPHTLTPRQKLVTVTLILTVIIIALCALALLVFVRVRARDGARRAGVKARADAWAESARRLVVEGPKRRDPDTGDTVDIDPSELSRGDIEPGPHDADDRPGGGGGSEPWGDPDAGGNGHSKPPSKGPHG